MIKKLFLSLACVAALTLPVVAQVPTGSWHASRVPLDLGGGFEALGSADVSTHMDKDAPSSISFRVTATTPSGHLTSTVSGNGSFILGPMSNDGYYYVNMNTQVDQLGTNKNEHSQQMRRVGIRFLSNGDVRFLSGNFDMVLQRE